MNFSRILAFFYNRNLYSAIDFAEKIQFKPLDEIRKCQHDKLEKLLLHVKENVPYYSSLNEDVFEIEQLEDIGFLTKKLIKGNFKLLCAENLPKDRFIENSTSGSTGQSMKFYSDEENYYRKAVNIRGDQWAGLKYGNKVLSLWGAERDIESQKSFYKKIKHRFVLKKHVLSSYHMSDDDLLGYSKKLNSYRPDIFLGYPTPLYRFAKYIENNKIKTWKPKGIITSAETLFPFQREFIESSFGARVFNRYGCREFGHIASECKEHNGMHYNADRFIIEIIDTDGNVCPPMVLGEIVVTDLDNYVFPMIRYKIGDLGMLSDRKCSCGINLPMIECIEGRVFELIHGENGNSVGGTYWTLLRNKINGWEKFQIIQSERNTLKIIVENNNNIEKDFKDRVTDIVKNKLGHSMELEIEIVERIPETETGKHRWIMSSINK